MLLVVPVFEGETGPAWTAADAACGGRLGAAVASRAFQGKAYTTAMATVVAQNWRPANVLAVGPRAARHSGSLTRPARGDDSGARRARAPLDALAHRASGPGGDAGRRGAGDGRGADAGGPLQRRLQERSRCQAAGRRVHDRGARRAVARRPRGIRPARRAGLHSGRVQQSRSDAGERTGQRHHAARVCRHRGRDWRRRRAHRRRPRRGPHQRAEDGPAAGRRQGERGAAARRRAPVRAVRARPRRRCSAWWGRA